MTKDSPPILWFAAFIGLLYVFVLMIQAIAPNGFYTPQDIQQKKAPVISEPIEPAAKEGRNRSPYML